MQHADMATVSSRLSRFTSVRWHLVFVGALLSGGIVVAHAQPVAPPKKNDSEIVINPTITECAAGWRDHADVKWSKEQFDKFCAVLQSPAPILANPTLSDCDKGWDGKMRWTLEQFDAFCVTLRKSK